MRIFFQSSEQVLRFDQAPEKKMRAEAERRGMGGIDRCHVTDYNSAMIRSFADRETQQLYVSGKSKRLPPELAKRALRRLEYIDVIRQ